jgi:nicotinamide mononucleotide transporter
MSFFDSHNVFFELWGYAVSYLEFTGLITGIVAVTLSGMGNVWSWPIGVVNVTLSFFLFYQVQLYPDMFLQVFFFVTNIIGWYRWTHPRTGEEDSRLELKISYMTTRELVITCSAGLAGTVMMAAFASNIHELLPGFFSKPSAAPFLDSFITVMSIVATYYMVQKKVECWILWLMVDIVGTYVYFSRDLGLYGLLYFAYCIIASFAWWNWARTVRSYSLKSV